MAQEEIKFSIADNESSQSPDGANVDLIVTYDPSVKDRYGAYIVTDATGTIQKVDHSGRVVGIDHITGLVQDYPSPGATDNELFIPADPNKSPIVTGDGFSFSIDNKADTIDVQGRMTGNLQFRDSSGLPARFPHNDTPYYAVSSFLYNGNPLTNFSETAVTCFVTGTLIRTTRGDVAVEQLAVGDRVVTASGQQRPIVWIGHRDMVADGGRSGVWPVRVSAHAFGPARPARDLYLSPGHPVLVGADEDGLGGHLVPIMCLVNGTTVERVPVETVTYWHVELDAHDILLAEGLPAESYLDWGDRRFFTEGADHALANPDFVVPGLGGRCRPIALDGPVVEAERSRLDGLFGTNLKAACDWPTADRLF